MNLQNLFKSFVYLFLVSLFYIMILIILSLKLPFWAGLLIIIAFLFIWKLIYGLAYLNYFILLSIFASSFILNMAFKLPSVMFFVLVLLSLFYIRAIYRRKLINTNEKTFIMIKYLFFFIVFFTNILSIYTLFYVAYWNFSIIFMLTLATLSICLLWYQKLDDIKMSFYEGLIFLTVASQITWFLFNFSGGFFIFPMLVVFWFYNLINFYKTLHPITWDKVNNWIVLPMILTLIFSFYIKI